MFFFSDLYLNEDLENDKFSVFKYGMSEKFTKMLDFHLFFGINNSVIYSAKSRYSFPFKGIRDKE